MKQALQLKTTQHLTMTTQLQQAIRLLQLSQQELKQTIENAVEQNPLLEIVEENNESKENLNNANNNDTTVSCEENDRENSDMLTQDWRQALPNSTQSTALDPELALAIHGQVDHTLHDHLLWQLNMGRFSDVDFLIASTIIDAIDDAGFLTVTLEDLQQTINQITTVDSEEIKAVLHQIQNFDPAGVAAATVQESLLIQLRQFPTTTPYLAQAEMIIRDHLDDLEHHHYRNILKATKLSESELEPILHLIRSLQPRPGNSYGNAKADYAIPDIIVRKHGKVWTASLNTDALPRVRIHSEYKNLSSSDSDAEHFIQQQLQDAEWFMKSLHSRHETLERVANSIVAKQQAFFETGPEAMQPLILKTVADELGLHESTISRVTMQKFLFCPRGVFELKYFFSNHLTSATGQTCSSTAIKALLKKMVAQEDPLSPLSDKALSLAFLKEGIPVARRTVSKYREELGIAPSHERKFS